MNIIVLTSTRADYSFYLPLLTAWKKDAFFNVKIVAFGSHLSEKHGFTVNQIEQDGFEVAYKIAANLDDDTPKGISDSIGTITHHFSEFWHNHKKTIDLVFALGDRFEMFAAVSSAVPFNIPFAHLYGGETTLGAIDNVYRHSITLMSQYHFTSSDVHSQRVIELIQKKEHVKTVGLLSLENLENMELLTIEEFETLWGIDLSLPTILFTFHPETIHPEINAKYAEELEIALIRLSAAYQILITMPNVDTSNEVLRQTFLKLASTSDTIIAVESLGMKGYFSAMKYCRLLLGNTSSGITEAASFNKYVVNLGDRQKGRTRSNNVIDCQLKNEWIIESVNNTMQLGEYKGTNIFKKEGGVAEIIAFLKEL